MNTETVETKGRGKGAKAVKVVGALLAAACLIGSLGLNVYQARAQRGYTDEMNAFIAEQKERWAKEEEQENSYVEDGFMVMDRYEIRSTTHISDAYKSGGGSQLSPADRETLDMAKAVLDEVLTDGMSRYEKELAVYRWMVENIGGRGSEGVIGRPGVNTDAFTPHDVLSSRSAVCVGYATTFRLFMNMLGMDCHIVHNDSHSWDLVEVEEGQWYHVDIYSDVHGTMFGNFNMTDDICNMNHSWDGSALPVADSVKYSPAVTNSVEVDSLTAVPAQMKKDLDEGKLAMFYRFKTPLTEGETTAAEFLAKLLEQAVTSLPDANYYWFRAYWYPGEGDEEILGFMVERDGDEPGGDDPAFDMDSPEAKAIIQAISEAFGTVPNDPNSDDPEYENGGFVPEPGGNGGSVVVD